jgi:monothiol glutaredoxin
MFNMANERALAAESIVKDLKSHAIVLYMKGTRDEPMCGFSARALACVKGLGAPFEVRNVLESDALRQAIKEHSDWPTLPQLYIGGEFVGGCDIICALYASGELAKLLESSGKV